MLIWKSLVHWFIYSPSIHLIVTEPLVYTHVNHGRLGPVGRESVEIEFRKEKSIGEPRNNLQV